MSGNIERAWVVHVLLALTTVFALHKPAQAQEREARVLHILEATQEEAQRSKTLILLLAMGDRQRYVEAFQRRARTVSKDTGSAKNGGDLDFVKPSAYAPEFAAAVLAAPVGEIVGPIKTQFGWHLLMVTEWRAAPPSWEPQVAPAADAVKERRFAILQRLRADWLHVGMPDDKSMLFRSKAIKDRGQGIKSAWVMFSYAQPQNDAGAPFQSTKELWWFRCSDEMISTTERVMYSGDDGGGNVVGTWSAKFDTKDLRDVVPGSVGEAVLRGVCGKR